MGHSDYSTLGGDELALSLFRCDACGRSIRSSRPLTVGRQVRCPICGVMTRVLVEANGQDSMEPTERPEAVGSGKILPAARSGIATSPMTPTPTPMASPSPSQKAAAANYPVVRGYTILGEIGRGASGVVYRARHDALKRVVALKILGVCDDSSAVLLGEAEAVAKLHHPNIVQIFEVGQGDGPPYLALEYVAGGHLRDRIEGKAQPIRAAARLIETLARAVQAAHARGLVHRDLKPGNVLMGVADPSVDEEPGEDVTAYGVAKIADFGLAMKLDRDDARGCGDELAGTPQYMAPEQALGLGHQLGPGVDIYALGVILYEMLAGRRPTSAQNIEALLIAIANKPPVPPREIRKAVPRDLEAICLKCLAKDPRDRYRTASALANDLHRFLDGEPVKARRSGPLGRAWLWSLRNPSAASLIGAAALLLGLGLPSLALLKRGIVQVAALQDAENQSRAILGVWDVYSKVIRNMDQSLSARHEGPPLPKTSGTDFDLSFRDTKDGRLMPDPNGLAPAPVTFIKLFGQKLDHFGAVDADPAPTSTFRVYSDFPLRKNDSSRPESGFGREAIDALAGAGGKGRKTYAKFLATRKGEVLHAAYPVVMQESCLKCHNDRSKYDPRLYDDVGKSPKLDWKEGEIRGVIEVIRPMDEDYDKTGDLLAWSLGGVLLAGSTFLVGGRAFLGAAGRRIS